MVYAQNLSTHPGSPSGPAEYQFVPARCKEHPVVDQAISGSLSLCSFPPNYVTPDSEDIRAVINHIKNLRFDWEKN
ncbi:uncharacterized protein [Drosophila takahashii]|uniref:uncharacterized protein n=1 Tax=Drosophila takahashii TaxID=29030 RepID=UPI001CF84E15|nr:uncharacterized protein LOC108063491 [Drosophila takahashii]